jgi:hypothetical protein
MSRPSLPKDIDDLIAQVSPFISANTNPVDTIRIALFRMKEDFILSNDRVSIDNPLHPFYSKVTPDEETKIVESRKEFKFKKNITKGSAKDVIAWLNN